MIPTMDFETTSEAGYYFDEGAHKWVPVSSSPPHGLRAVGAPAYAEHASTAVDCLYYDLLDGNGPVGWLPWMAPPQPLFDYLATGGLIEAHNASFEYWVWNSHCVPVLGWPHLDYRQMRCSMAKCLRWSIPAKLEDAGGVLQLDVQKDKRGKNLIKRYAKPTNPPAKTPARRHLIADNPIDAADYYQYCATDNLAEQAVSAATPDLCDEQLKVFLHDFMINLRGCYVDTAALESMAKVLELATLKYEAELSQVTGGVVNSAGKLEVLKAWLNNTGYKVGSLDAAHLQMHLDNPACQGAHRRALEIRDILGSASVKKIAALLRRVTKDGRMHDMFQCFGADRTDRWAGRGPQPQNLPASGPKLAQCDPINGCGHYYAPGRQSCPWCGLDEQFSDKAEWCVEAIEDALQCLHTRRLDVVEGTFGDAIQLMLGCLRGMFRAAPGCELICSDYAAIEAVVLATLAGEQWRLDVFRTHGKIYEMSLAKISGTPFEQIMAHAGYTDLTKPQWWEAPQTGPHHPLRKKIGKVAELGSGYQGSVGAWKAFGAEDYFFSDEEILEKVRAWRRENPAIVNFWYGLERAAMAAIRSPGEWFQCRDIGFIQQNDILHLRLPSGRFLYYHRAQIQEIEKFGKLKPSITYWGYNRDANKGRIGWHCLDTYGGKLCENVCQAVARDILANAIINLEAAGYPIVMHVHDEIVAEVLAGSGSVEQFEQVMGAMPDWAAHYPIKASGGWRGLRYRKD